MSFNKVILMGNLTKDIQLRYVDYNGVPCAVTDMRIAVDCRNEKTLFIDVVLWRKLAEIANSYLKKGSPVLVEGRLEEDSWTDNEGNKRYKVKVIADDLRLLPRNKPKEEENVENSNSNSNDDNINDDIDIDQPVLF